jgi:hypothetical protein
VHAHSLKLTDLPLKEQFQQHIQSHILSITQLSSIQSQQNTLPNSYVKRTTKDAGLTKQITLAGAHPHTHTHTHTPSATPLNTHTHTLIPTPTHHQPKQARTPTHHQPNQPRTTNNFKQFPPSALGQLWLHAPRARHGTTSLLHGHLAFPYRCHIPPQQVLRRCKSNFPLSRSPGRDGQSIDIPLPVSHPYSSSVPSVPERNPFFRIPCQGPSSRHPLSVSHPSPPRQVFRLSQSKTPSSRSPGRDNKGWQTPKNSL